MLTFLTIAAIVCAVCTVAALVVIVRAPHRQDLAEPFAPVTDMPRQRESGEVPRTRVWP